MLPILLNKVSLQTCYNGCVWTYSCVSEAGVLTPLIIAFWHLPRTGYIQPTHFGIDYWFCYTLLCQLRILHYPPSSIMIRRELHITLPWFSFSSSWGPWRQSGWWRVSQRSFPPRLRCELSSWCGSSCSPRTLGATWSACCLCKIKWIRATLASKVSLWPSWCNLSLGKIFSPLFNGILISFLLQVCTVLCSWACCKTLDYNSDFFSHPTSPLLSPFGLNPSPLLPLPTERCRPALDTVKEPQQQTSNCCSFRVQTNPGPALEDKRVVD